MKRVLAALCALAGASGCYGTTYVETPAPQYGTTMEYIPEGPPPPISVTMAPPAPRYEAVLTCGYGTIYVPGRWEFSGRWYWARGYCSPVRPGHIYVGTSLYRRGVPSGALGSFGVWRTSVSRRNRGGSPRVSARPGVWRTDGGESAAPCVSDGGPAVYRPAPIRRTNGGGAACAWLAGVSARSGLCAAHGSESAARASLWSPGLHPAARRWGIPSAAELSGVRARADAAEWWLSPAAASCPRADWWLSSCAVLTGRRLTAAVPLRWTDDPRSGPGRGLVGFLC
jgi:hypothetical protein